MKRLVCLLMGHRYVKTPYPNADTADGFYLRCLRCCKDTDPATTNVNGAFALGFRHW